MPRPKQKTKAEDLARVRNNQRNSRARKRQYVVELERKIQQLEAAKAEASDPNLALENRLLKGLLQSLGFDNPSSLASSLPGPPPDVLHDSMSSLLPVDPPTSSDMPLFGLPAELSTVPEIPSYGPSQLGPVTTAESSFTLPISQLFESLGGGLSPSPQTLDLALLLPPNVTQGQGSFDAGWNLSQDLAGIRYNLGVETGAHSSSVDATTTLCSVAFRLIIQCNRSGMDVLELETKLRYGYMMSANPAEPCRVDNKTLLTVLSELI